MWRAPLLLVFTANALLSAASVRAAGVETLLMPGKVSAAHAKYEGDCAQCHDRSNRARQPQLCLACHKDTAADVAARRGFHGQIPNAAGTQCSGCHSEHQGRDASLARLSSIAFDHLFTDFPLDGSHASVDCAGCHRTGVAHRNAPSACIDCHRKQDPHNGELGSRCNDCHVTAAWREVRFDHGRTRFALGGAHMTLACGACHVSGRYANTPRECASCHTADDVHRGARGSACANCHRVASWTNTSFDHARDAHFPLAGRHARLDCAACHRSGNYQTALARECTGCHRPDDMHGERLGTACKSCHTEEKWSFIAFEHTRDAGFALAGKHASLACHVCHTASIGQQKLAKDCATCHRIDDVHAGPPGTRCDQCHSESSWHPARAFDHDFATFPLTGLHAIVPCASCHATPAFRGTSSSCHGCHAERDVHKGALGTACVNCHTTSGWSLWQFDHATTHFPLTGAHAGVACGACHSQPPGSNRVSTECVQCHRRDDAHLGQFGRDCQRCHNTATFRGARQP